MLNPPLQNCTTSYTGRVIGKQNVAKSEILGCYAAAKDTPEGQSIINILDNLGVVTTLNRGPPRFSRHRLRRNNRPSWNLLFGTIERRHITMSGLWMKGHTKRTSIVNKLQNETDKRAGIATNNNDIEFNRFPLYDKDFLVFDNKGDLIECDIKLAAIQRAAQVQYIKFREKRLIDNNNPSTLINFTDKLIMKLGGAHNIDKTSQSTLRDPSQHRLIIHARSNSLPSGTRLHKLNPAAFPLDTCPLCETETDTPAHALWECSKHKTRLEILTKDIINTLLHIQDPITDSWRAAPNTSLSHQQEILNSKWPHTFKLTKTSIIFQAKKEPDDPHKNCTFLNKDHSINLEQFRKMNIPGITGRKEPDPAPDFMHTISFTKSSLPPIKLARFWELLNNYKGDHSNFPQSLARAIQSESLSMHDTGLSVDSRMSWAGDRHLTNILAKWVHTEIFSSASNCNFNFKQSFTARRKDNEFGLEYDGLAHRDINERVIKQHQRKYRVLTDPQQTV